jgi:hypothetical protein
LVSLARRACNSAQVRSNDKMSAEDKESINSMLKEATEWLDGHQNGTKEEYDTKQKE